MVPIRSHTCLYFSIFYFLLLNLLVHIMWDVVLCKQTNGIEKKLSGIQMLQPLHFVRYYFNLV